VNLPDISDGLRIRLLGPDAHPLHGARGVVVRVFTADELWHRQPMDMLGDPFTWLGGQVLVSLDEPRPRDLKGRPWTPVVTVRPEEVQPA
jgi:hypothetical protein